MNAHESFAVGLVIGVWLACGAFSIGRWWTERALTATAMRITGERDALFSLIGRHVTVRRTGEVGLLVGVLVAAHGLNSYVLGAVNTPEGPREVESGGVRKALQDEIEQLPEEWRRSL